MLSVHRSSNFSNRVDGVNGGEFNDRGMQMAALAAMDSYGEILFCASRTMMAAYKQSRHEKMRNKCDLRFNTPSVNK